MKSPGMRLIATVVTALVVAAWAPACADSSGAGGGGDTDLGSACTDLCTSVGFDRTGFDMTSNEANCFCLGGTGTVSQPACQSMCDSIGYPGAQPFAQNAGTPFDACKCTK